ncbi:hypothetical protein JAO73_14820 [Hymenobacter sp. BT523]|uniref:hypothetical protein n=1 Tax=Hymenobacter sp. BT523 TaxID=2795725 RepID=UPI0018EE0C8D|nr:hypothetical protein [Hymenobacter sp. BT523]MBJ6110294.1 hypothetical protein [Hymenobacter sp. BT523]
MKQTYYPFLLAGLLVACQQQKPVAVNVAVDASAPVPVAKDGEKALPSLFAAADTLTGPMRQLLREIDLSKLWQGDTQYRRENPTLQGFFGPDHYRFALAFTSVQRDARHPEVYHVRGKCRYRKNIRPFEGTLTVRQVADLDAPWDYDEFTPQQQDSTLTEAAANDSAEAQYERARQLSHPYTLRAELAIQEAAAPNSGVFRGEAVLNFHVASRGRLDYVTAPFVHKGVPANGSEMLVHGARRNLTTREVKTFVVAADVFAAAPEVYKDFGIGDRGGEVNPKYAKLGWNEVWENDEWWAASPKPSLSL